MTPDELGAEVEAGRIDELVRLLRDATEDSRRAAAPRALLLRRRHDDLQGTGSPDQTEASKVAVYGTAVVSELRALRGTGPLPPRHLETDVLSPRPASVVGPIVDWRLQKYWGWDTARQLVRARCIPTPRSEWYLLRLIARGPGNGLLTADPALLDDEVWRLFEIEGSGEFCLAAHDKYVPDADTWQTALLTVAAADPARRMRLLDASLDALARDFSTFRAGWFSRFHEALAPTLEERADRLDRYLVLLRSAVKPTVTMAVAALDRLGAAERLDGHRVVGRLGPALAGAPASTAAASLKVLRRIWGRSPALSARIAHDAAEAIAHPSADVQAAALHLIEELGVDLDDALADRVRALHGGLAPSQRAAANALLARIRSEGAVADSRTVVAPSPAPAAPLAPLDASRAMVPVSDVDELVELLGGLLEDAEDADGVERALDGVARLSSSVTGPDPRLKPLHTRAAALLGRRVRSTQESDLRQDIAALVLSWLGGTTVVPPRLGLEARRAVYTPDRAGTRPTIGVDRFLARRLVVVATTAAQHRSFTPLATPTHSGGWIAPDVLVDRLSRADANDVDRLDLVQALLRLAVEGRQRALPMAEHLRGEAGGALRHALGAAGEGIGPTPAIWAAAARARSAGGDDLELAARHPYLGPNAGMAARIDFATGTWSEVPGGLDLVLEPSMPGQLDEEQPATVMLAAPFLHGFGASGDAAMCRWVSTVWPAGVEAWAAVGAVVIGRNLDWWSAEWTNRIHLEALMPAWATLGPMALTLLGLGLGSKERGERGLATDAAIAACTDGRLGPATLSEALRSARRIDRARPRRWAESLGEVAAASPNHGAIVLHGATSALDSLVSLPGADLVPLLRLLNELVQDGHRTISDPAAVAALRALPGSGTARRLASEILAFGSPGIRQER